MATKNNLMDWVVEALVKLGGSAPLVEVCKQVWGDLARSGDLFYTWQYDIRWAAQSLRDSGVLEPSPGRGSTRPWRLREGVRSAGPRDD